jgi:serine O-acetyltransferase
MIGEMRRDFRAIYEGDPAIPKNWAGRLETILCTPGLHAMAAHRVIHRLQRAGIPVLPRFLSMIMRFLTGIEIHPGARIGAGTFIDHGMGVVIGETAEIGEDCLIYHGATLGATGNEKERKRHPTLGKNVLVGSGARILGPVHVGDGARIGAGAVVLEDVPPGVTVAGPKARIVRRRNQAPLHPMERNEENGLGSTPRPQGVAPSDSVPEVQREGRTKARKEAA